MRKASRIGSALWITGLLAFAGNAQAAFDHSHSQWNVLVRKHVVWITEGKASQVDYAGFLADRAALQAYLGTVSAVSLQEYDAFSPPQRLAFLINAYNAFTIELILTRYPELKSIKDLGSFFTSPWKKKFFRLLGERKSLDEIEHGMIRAPGAFDEPRIHMALVCASIGCPALRNEAYVAWRIDAQLEDNVRRFLSDHSRNRYNKSTKSLEVSKTFDWYDKDFAGEAGSVRNFLVRYCRQLITDDEDEHAIREGKPRIKFLDYNWQLNDVRK